MKVYGLTFEEGIESGHVRLLGIYESIERAEDVVEKHMHKSICSKLHYRIDEFELNKEIDITIAEW